MQQSNHSETTSECRSSKQRATSSQTSSNTTYRKSPNDFQNMQQTLGKGSFGWVTLVKEKSTGKQFAMKTLKKEDLFQYCSVDNLKREIKIQRKLNHPNIIVLNSYFEDKLNVYLILEYAENGSLFKDIKKKRQISEKQAAQYLYQTCLGIEYLHKQKIVHRDIKPENLLLDKNNNIKICDFGWSTEIGNSKKAFCGTIEYMAPEMIRSQSTNYKLDIWCLGVLLFEMIQGRPPFIGKTEQEKYQAILSGHYHYDPFISVSDDCKNLISMILQQNPLNRPSIQSILNHKWMRNQRGEDITNARSSSLVMDNIKLSSSPLRSCQTILTERNDRNSRITQHFVYPQQDEPSLLKRILISLGCISR